MEDGQQHSVMGFRTSPIAQADHLRRAQTKQYTNEGRVDDLLYSHAMRKKVYGKLNGIIRPPENQPKEDDESFEIRR